MTPVLGKSTSQTLVEFIITTMKPKNQLGQSQRNWQNLRVSLATRNALIDILTQIYLVVNFHGNFKCFVLEEVMCILVTEHGVMWFLYIITNAIFNLVAEIIKQEQEQEE